MSKKFIPNGDLDFLSMAQPFAETIAKEPGRFDVSSEEAGSLVAAVDAFRDALYAAGSGATRSPVSIRAKEVARQEAERRVRDIANRVRVNRKLGIVDRAALRMRERSTRAKQTTVPAEPPRLRFLRALHEGSGSVPMHELAFYAAGSWNQARPEGAVRLELFVDLVPPEEQIPAHPFANSGGRPWYLRSYTKSPIVLQPPMPRVPMRIVYWGRWADSMGNVGPFSATAVGWTEGGTHRVIPFVRHLSKPMEAMEDYAASGPAHREKTYVVALRDEQYRALNPQGPAAQLPPSDGEHEQRRLGPGQGEEASEAA